MDPLHHPPRRDAAVALVLIGMAVAALVLAGDRVRGILGNTLQLATAATILAALVGTVHALLLAKTDVVARRFLWLLTHVLLFVPLFVHVAGWKAGFGVGGWFRLSPETVVAAPLLDGWWGAIWIHGMAGVPWVATIVGLGLRGARSAAEEAASLVVSPWRVLTSISLRGALPAILVASAWVFLMTASEMTVTDYFQIRTFAEEIYTQESMGGAPIDNPAADEPPWARWPRSIGLLAGTTVLTTMALGILLVMHRWASADREPVGYRPWRAPLAGLQRLVASIVPALILIVVAGLPVGSLIYRAGVGSHQTPSGWVQEWSIGNLMEALSRALPNYGHELIQSLWVGLAVATTCVLVGIPLAWRFRTARGAPFVLLAVIALMLAVPGPLLGLVVIRIMNQPGDSVFAWLTPLYDRTIVPWWLVQSLRYFGVAALVIGAAMAKISPTLFEAARVDGAGGIRQLMSIALPLSWRGVVASWLLTFALSVGDLAASVVIAPPMRPTLAIQIFRDLHYGADDRVAAVSLVLLLVVGSVGALAMWLWSAGRSSRNVAVSPSQS